MSIKVLHTADIHLGTRFPGLGEFEAQRAQDFLNTFSRIVNVALEQKVDLVLIAGDLFDSPHPSNIVFGRVKADLEKLMAAQIPIALIPGTHDNIMASDHIYRHPFFEQTILFKDPVLLAPRTISLQGIPVHLYGMAYHPDVHIQYLENLKRRDVPGIHLGLLHGSIQGSPEWKIYTKDFPISEADLFSLNLDYCGLGHYHNSIIYRQNGVIKASYTGTPEGKRFRESGPRFVHLLEFHEGKNLELIQIPVNTRTLFEKELDLFTLPPQSSLEKELIPLGGGNKVARIILKGNTDAVLDIEKIHSDVSPHFAYLELVDETSVINSQWIERLEKENTIRGYFVRKMKEKISELKDAEEKEIYLAAFKEVLSTFEKRA